MLPMMDIAGRCVRRVVFAHSERISGGPVCPKRSPESNLNPRELARLAIENMTEIRLRKILDELKEEESSAQVC